MYFDELDLNDNVLDALYDMRFDTCTPVQEKCIPEILKGNDVMGVAQTGTGKTAAYLLPVLSKLDDGGYPNDAINCVIMSPTRELAQQIDQAMQGFGYYLQGVSSVAVYGGNDGNRYDQELKSLRMGADVVIATPGRLISHISLGNVDLSKVSFFILDEADRMLDMGFSEDIKTIAAKLPKSCQTIMFSATMPEKIEELAKTLLKDPVEIKLAVSKPAEKIKQEAYVCYETQKMTIIKEIFKAGDMKRVIVFSGSKMKVKQLAAALQQIGINCGAMHSDLEQAERDDVMFKFKSGRNTLRRSFFLIPFPVSETSTMALSSVSSTCRVICPPSTPIASTAFLERFSITHSKSEALILMMMSWSGKSFTIFTFLEVRRSI